MMDVYREIFAVFKGRGRAPGYFDLKRFQVGQNPGSTIRVLQQLASYTEIIVV
jgi:hypothetical protein